MFHRAWQGSRQHYRILQLTKLGFRVYVIDSPEQVLSVITDIWTCLYYNSSKNAYRGIRIAYAAPGSTERLIEFERQIDYEADLDLDAMEAIPSNEDMSGL